jgi:hypothetical protein
MKTTKVKTFDAVKIQREIRNKISSETANMSFAELKKYVEQRVEKSGPKPVGKEYFLPLSGIKQKNRCNLLIYSGLRFFK